MGFAGSERPLTFSTAMQADLSNEPKLDPVGASAKHKCVVAENTDTAKISAPLLTHDLAKAEDSTMDPSTAPEMRPFNTLGLGDFETHPVWIRVRSFDFHRLWYDDVDEETFRAWDGTLPFVEPRGQVLIGAKFKFAVGGVYPGFLSPAKEDWDVPLSPKKVGDRLMQRVTLREQYGGSPLAILGIQQPRIFLKNQVFSFWGGRKGIPQDIRKAFYAAAAKAPDYIFPIQFSANPRFADGLVSGHLEGFYKALKGSSPECLL